MFKKFTILFAVAFVLAVFASSASASSQKMNMEEAKRMLWNNQAGYFGDTQYDHSDAAERVLDGHDEDDMDDMMSSSASSGMGSSSSSSGSGSSASANQSSSASGLFLGAVAATVSAFYLF